MKPNWATLVVWYTFSKLACYQNIAKLLTHLSKMIFFYRDTMTICWVKKKNSNKLKGDIFRNILIRYSVFSFRIYTNSGKKYGFSISLENVYKNLDYWFKQIILINFRHYPWSQKVWLSNKVGFIADLCLDHFSWIICQGLYIWLECSPMVWETGSIPGRVIPKTQKMVLNAALLNTQHYKVRIKDKVEQSRERSSALLYTYV